MNDGRFAFPSTLVLDAGELLGYAREPVLRRMPNGDLLVMVLSGGPTEPDNRNCVYAVRSADDGITWSEPQVAFRHGARGTWVTEIFREGDTVAAFVHTYDAMSRYRELGTHLATTSDDGLTWTEPRSLPSGVRSVSVRQGLTLDDGTWLFPVYWQETTGDWDWTRRSGIDDMSMAWPTRCGVMTSPDRGASFEIHGYLTADVPLWENAIATAGPELVMFMRAQGSGRLYVSRSEDAGFTWSAAEPTDIPNPGSKVSLVSVGDAVVLFHNPAPIITGGHADRRPLSAWASRDGCRTWYRKVDLGGPDLAVFYPHPMLEPERGLVYLACENGRQHYLLKIPLDAVL